MARVNACCQRAQADVRGVAADVRDRPLAAIRSIAKVDDLGGRFRWPGSNHALGGQAVAAACAFA
jgi:hypothetical protein